VAKSAATKKSKAGKAKTANPIVSTGFWLFKSEPNVFSYDDLVAKGKRGEEWDGVRNYLARNNMRAMQIGDLGFFYHSNIGKEVVGVCEVCKGAHPDSTTDDERWECVDVRAVCPFPNPVTLAEVKGHPKLQDMSLVTSMRLSVQPVTQAEWEVVCRLGGLDPKTLKPAASASKKLKSGRKA
jgi:predicted RNA-binding protein with PUA-like domain